MAALRSEMEMSVRYLGKLMDNELSIIHSYHDKALNAKILSRGRRSSGVYELVPQIRDAYYKLSEIVDSARG